MNDNYQDEEINLKDMFFYVLRQLKALVISGIVVGIILCVFMGFKGYKKQIGLNEYAVLKESEYEDFEQTKKRLNAAINDRRIDFQNYMNNSSFLSLNPYDTYQATATYYISTDYEILLESQVQNFDYTNAVLSTYVDLLKDSNVVNEISKKYDIENFEEFINIYTYNHILSINVYNSDELVAKNILQDLEDNIPSIKKQIESTIGDNEISLLNVSTLKGSQSGLISLQNDKTQYLSALLEKLNTLQTNLTKLEDPSLNASPVKKGIKSGIKGGVLGFIVGFFMLVVLYGIKFAIKDTVYSADELKDRTKLRVIGTIANNEEKTTKLLRWINKKENRVDCNDNERNYRVIASNIKICLGNKDKILISNNVSKEKENELVNKLHILLPNIQIINKGNILNSPEAIDALTECNNVILLAECNETKYKSLLEEKELLTNLDKNIMGCVVID